MKKLRTASAVAAAGVAAVLVAGSALAGTTVKKPIAFTGAYAGTAVVKVADNVANISANGSGKGLLIGSGKITGTGTGDSSQQPCVPFTGPGKITGAKGIRNRAGELTVPVRDALRALVESLSSA